MKTTPESALADAQVIIADLRRQLAERTAELDEGEAQKAAMAEVLEIINTSPGHLAPVFNAILENAHLRCGAEHGSLVLRDGAIWRAVATHNYAEAFAERLRLGFDGSENPAIRPLLDGAPFVQIADLADTDHPVSRAAAELGGIRTGVFVALRRDGELLGHISASRPEVRPFTGKQIALLQNFAEQAVIAMENARLITETREALEQQTATAEVLQVINSSPGDLAPVFDAILEKAHAFCEAPLGSLVLFGGEQLRAIATRGYPPEYDDLARRGFPPILPFKRLLDGEPYVLSKPADQEPDPDDAMRHAAVEIAGIRTGLFVPLRKDDTVLGYISAQRQEVRPFTYKQIALLQNFAGQAVIAMENARLLGELRGRTHDLQEALEYQTATSDLLQVISRSTFDLQPVLDTLVETATRLCVADQAVVFDDSLMLVANFGYPAEYEAFHRARGPTPVALSATSPTTTARAVRERRVIHIEDITTVTGYSEAAITLGKQRTSLGVPLLREGEPIGVLALARQRVEPFTERQIELVRTFADQAVIAMENARLLGELRQRTNDLEQSLEYQTATSDVLKVISRSTFDLQPVLDTLVETATRLCNADHGNLFRRDGDGFRRAAVFGLTSEMWNRGDVLGVTRGSIVGRVILDAGIIHVHDVASDPEYMFPDTIRLRGVRSTLGVPLLREGEPVGVFTLGRRRVEPFTERQIELVRTFADQAVIAIENARLLGELRQRTDEVAELNRGLEARVSEQVEELGRVGRLKRFLAPQLAEMIVSQGDEKILESHRREIVVVFCDLRGYTAFTETAEPEEVLDFLREYHGALGPLVSQFEGTLDQFSGDGIMVFFNDPVPIPDPAERAVNMALAMREAAGKLIANWRRHGGELGFGVGIAQGFATLGQIGFADRSGYTAIGTVCNLAARLCAEAKDGQILISSRVAEAVEAVAQLEHLGALDLKGLRRPVAAFNVGEQVSDTSAHPQP